MTGASPARLYATLAGAGLVVFGIVGFFYSASFGSPGAVDEVFGIFAVNGWDNVLHILAGTIGLLVAGFAPRRYCAWAGAGFALLAVWGFIVGSGAVLGCFPVNTATNLLHAVLGATGLLAVQATPRAGRGGLAAG